MAAAQLDEPAAALGVQGGWVFVKRDPSRRLPYEAVARAGHFRGGGRVLVAEAFYDPPTTMLDKDFQGNVSAAYTSAFQAALVDVDPDTGRVIMSWSNFTPVAAGGVEISTTYSDNITAAAPTWSTRRVVAATDVDGQGSIPRFAGRGSGNAYVAWSRFPDFFVNNIGFARSTDNGATWSAPVSITSGRADASRISSPSGIRVGTPACSTLGMDEPEMREIAGVIGDVLRHPEDAGSKEKARDQVRDLMQRFPLYP